MNAPRGQGYIYMVRLIYMRDRGIYICCALYIRGGYIHEGGASTGMYAQLRRQQDRAQSARDASEGRCQQAGPAQLRRAGPNPNPNPNPNQLSTGWPCSAPQGRARRHLGLGLGFGLGFGFGFGLGLGLGLGLALGLGLGLGLAVTDLGERRHHDGVSLGVVDQHHPQPRRGKGNVVLHLRVQCRSWG